MSDNTGTAFFPEHIDRLQRWVEDTLTLLGEEGIRMEGVVFHSGSEKLFYGDDAHIPFRAHASYLHWLPVARPDQMVLVQPGQKPVWFRVIPDDFWYDTEAPCEDWYANCFEIVQTNDPKKVVDHLPASRHLAFVGEQTEFASRLGLPSHLHNEPNLVNRLDYLRSIKDAYEVTQTRLAHHLAIRSHAAAEEAFREGLSERGINAAYLNAIAADEYDMPYHNIVGLDEKGAILHYQHRRHVSGKNSKVLLIDAGAKYRHYACDLTRTHVREAAHPVFKELVPQVESMMLDLLDQCSMGTAWLDLHRKTETMILDALVAQDVLRGDRDAMDELKLGKLFMPHGLGHNMGLLVHDVAGYFQDDRGVLKPPPKEYSTLRMNRKLEEGQVVTVEPGIYFIPVLLNPERETQKGQYINWDLVDELIPNGGIRFEDNAWITADGPVNLTREELRVVNEARSEFDTVAG